MPGSTLEPALLSRLLLCQYAGLVKSLDKCPGDSSVPTQAAAQALQLHVTLRSITPAAPVFVDWLSNAPLASRHDVIAYIQQ